MVTERKTDRKDKRKSIMVGNCGNGRLHAQRRERKLMRDRKQQEPPNEGVNREGNKRREWRKAEK